MDKKIGYCFADTKEPLFYFDLDDKTYWGWIDGTLEISYMTNQDAIELLALGKIVKEPPKDASLPELEEFMFGIESQNPGSAMTLTFGDSNTKSKDDPELESSLIKLPATYDHTLVNTSIDPDVLAAKLEIALKKEDRPNCISLLFDGVPGTGKTMAAAYIASKMDRKLASYKLGELLGKYVGESEQKIQEAFTSAQEKGHILHFDEIDSIATDRDTADRGHEVKAVNALLQAMDTFEGIFIATTNSKKGLDTAIKRRFLLKQEFKNVTSEQADKLAKLFFKRKAPVGLPDDVMAPADFALVKNSLLFVDDSEINRKFILGRLIEEAKERNGEKLKSKPIGFITE